jgi:flagellin
MPVTMTANGAASVAMRTLDQANRNLTSSLKRLSSGNRIANIYDDAASEAVQLKMSTDIARLGVARTGIQNAMSFLEVQDGFLQTASSLVSRLGELKAMADDPSKSTADVANYQEEFQVLQAQLGNLANETFNGSAIWSAESSQEIATSAVTSANLTIYGNSNTIEVTGANGIMINTVGNTDAGEYDNTITVSGISSDAINSDIQNIANARARNGAYQSVLNYAYDNASTVKTNLEAARGRITDVDIAEESGKFARAQIKTQAAASMLAQANRVGGQTLLQLLG